MAIDHEDFVRCATCGSADFTEETILTIPKSLKPRASVKEPLKGAETEYHVICTNCRTRIHI